MLVFVLNAGSSSLKYQLMNPVIKKVFAGKVISRLFLLIQTDVDETISFLINDIRKDILDFEYC